MTRAAKDNQSSNSVMSGKSDLTYAAKSHELTDGIEVTEQPRADYAEAALTDAELKVPNRKFLKYVMCGARTE
jgi:hypothetical protein